MFEFLSHNEGSGFNVSAITKKWKEINGAATVPDDVQSKPCQIIDSKSPIGLFNTKHGNPEWMLSQLEKQGYKFRSTQHISDEVAYRYLSPDSSSGIAGVILFFGKDGKWRVYSHQGDVLGQSPHSHDAFSLHTIFAHDGDQHKAIASLSKSIKHPTVDNLDWTKEFMVSSAQMDKFSAPEFIIENLIIRGHLCVFPAEPNGGKTTIFMELAGQMAEPNYRVMYVNADVSGGDAKDMHKQALDNNFDLLLPDLADGKSMDDLLLKLKGMAESSGIFDDVVFIFDTLKKMTDVISKSQAKELYKTLRALTAKGMTIILLAHTNKYEDKDGNPIYEGTGDLRADVDELIYLIPQKHPDGSTTVSTKPDKVRGNIKPISFLISPNREVTLLDDYIDTSKSKKLTEHLERDRQCIDHISSILESDDLNKKQIYEHCGDEGIGKRVADKTLSRYSIPININFPSHELPIRTDTLFWGRYKGTKNSWHYRLLPLEKKMPNLLSFSSKAGAKSG